VLQDLVDILEPQVQAKELLTSHLLAGIFVKGDAAQLTRLFSNLLENAFKYTPAGGCDSMAKQQRFVLVSVKDTGMELLQNICRSFSSVLAIRQSSVSTGRGFGLGLADRQAIAQEHRERLQLAVKWELVALQCTTDGLVSGDCGKSAISPKFVT